MVEFFPERFVGGRYHGMTLGMDAFSFEQIIAWGDQIYADMAEQAAGRKPLDDAILSRAEGEYEQLIDILRSIARDERRMFFANVPNHGAVPNLPADAILELPVIATASGLRAANSGLPRAPSGNHHRQNRRQPPHRRRHLRLRRQRPRPLHPW